ncbi:MAG: PEP-CTERM sorting domain-containing protein, partial [Anaerolineae bacterium]
GPGDLRGPAPFTVSTDNGTLNGSGSTIEAFINEPNGVLKVTLVPHSGGTATVTVQGPCGLHAFITLGTWEFVPEPGSVALLATGLVGLAGYATLRWRSRQ